MVRRPVLVLHHFKGARDKATKAAVLSLHVAMLAPWWLSMRRLLVYQNETRLIGRPNLRVIITETGWSRDFCTEEERASWQVSAWQAWFDDPQLLAACPFDLEGPRIQGFPWIDPSGKRLPVFTETEALRCKLLLETCRNCLTALPDAREPNVTGQVSLQPCGLNAGTRAVHAEENGAGAAQLWIAESPGEDGAGENLSGNVTLSVNVSAPGSSRTTFWRQYLSCRADGQPGHACQPGDDVNVWFGAGPSATNQQWTIRPCEAPPRTSTFNVDPSPPNNSDGSRSSSHAVENGVASLLVSAMSSACVSSEGLMVGCNCSDSKQLWHLAVATSTDFGTRSIDSTAAIRYQLINQR